MKKKLLSAALVMMMILSLVACSKGDSTTETKTTTDASAEAEKTTETTAESTSTDATETKEVTTVEVWSNNRHDETYMTSQVDAFNASHSDVQINYTIMTDDWQNSIQLAYQAGTAPDVITIAASDGMNLKDYVTTGMFESLSSYIDKDTTFQQVTEPYDHKYEGLNSLGDEIYWVPNGVRSGTRIEYNIDLLKAAGYDAIPTTLSELVAMTKEITAKGNGDTYGVGFTNGAFGRWLEGVGEKSGFNHGGYDYKTGTYDFSSWKPLLETAAMFMKDGSVLPGSETQGVDNSRALFAQGSFAVWGNASQEAGVFTNQFPITTFEWGVAELPTMDGTVKGAQSITPNFGFALMSSAKNKEASWQVINFFSSEEFLKGYFEGGFSAPLSGYMTGKIDATKVGRLADFALKEYEDVYPSTPAITVEGQYWGDVFWNVILGNIDADSAIADVNQRYNDALERGLANGSVKRLVIADFDPLHPSRGTSTFLDK